MDERWLKVIAVICGSLGAVLMATLIFAFFEVNDRGLIMTAVSMMSGSFAIDLFLRLRRRFGEEA